jgi:putrescine transport system substrate-binding protein
MSLKIVSLLSALVMAGSAGFAGAQERVVNVYNWSDYIDQSILEEFTKETGIKVVYDVYDSNEVLETKLLAGGSGYDVVVPSAYFLQRQIAAGVYQPLDKSKLPNLVNMWDVVMKGVETFDPGNAYSVDYMWGTTGIGYNVEKVKAALGTDAKPNWDALFKPENAAKLKDCGIYMLDSPTDVIPSVLVYLGLDPNSTDAGDLAKAEEVLLAIRPYVRKFHSSEYINALANGDICIAIGFSGDVFQARDRAAEANAGVEVNFSIPDQGAQLAFDVFAVPADAKHVDEAHAFINFMMKPEVAAKATNYVYYANGNKASQPFLDKDVLEDPAIYPPEAVMAKLFTIKPLAPKEQRVVTRLWTKVTTGQ